MNNKLAHPRGKHRYDPWVLALLFYTLLVIVWGAWVRISKSGDGCGDTWPLCRDQWIPTVSHLPTWIEFSHRLTSGLFGIFVLVATIAAFRIFPRGHRARTFAVATLFFTVTEALLGANLVLAGLVKDNASVQRAAIMSLHFLNSLLLTGSVTLLWFFSRADRWQRTIVARQYKLLLLGLGLAVLLIGMTGTIAALSTTLFPSHSLLEGLTEDLNGQAHFSVRYRWTHPALAIGLGSLLFLALTLLRSAPWRSPLKGKLPFFVLFALAFGMMTLLSLSPVWMKLVHLLIAHGVWILLLLFSVPAFFTAAEADQKKFNE
jgi:cytochrome c oxidase assembly protein subunit 15